MQARALLLTAILALCPYAISQDQKAQGAEQTNGAQPPARREDIRHQKDLESDLELGAKYAAEADKTYKKTKNAELQARADRVGGVLAEIARVNNVEVTWGDGRLNPFPYKFTVIEGEDVNAFSLPGGFIYLYEGLLKYCESDDELAGVLAHEIAHASFRHLATLKKEQSKLDAITLPLILLSLLTGGTSAGPLVYGTVLTGQAIGSGWSVKAEESADFGGFQYLQKSPYNPVGMLTFMERLAYDDRTKPKIDWGIFQTHPPGRERANRLIARLKEGSIPIRRSEVTRSFRCDVRPGDNGVELLFGTSKIHTFAGSAALTRADEAAVRINQCFDQVPTVFEIQRRGELSIYGKGVQLFEVTADDAEKADLSIGATVDAVLQNLKKIVFELGYRVWNAY